jgi:hypothetical protein
MGSERRVGQPPNQALHLTGAALLVSRGITFLQAALAGELGRWGAKRSLAVLSG